MRAKSFASCYEGEGGHENLDPFQYLSKYLRDETSHSLQMSMVDIKIGHRERRCLSTYCNFEHERATTIDLSSRLSFPITVFRFHEGQRDGGWAGLLSYMASPLIGTGVLKGSRIVQVGTSYFSGDGGISHQGSAPTSCVAFGRDLPC